MKQKDKAYYFGDAEFDALIRKGVICSLQKTGDVCGTQYADTVYGFGAVYLAYRDEDGKLTEFSPNEQEAYREEAPFQREGCLTWCGSGCDENLEVKTEYCLEHGRLDQTVTVTNQSEKELVLSDIGILQACHTDFKWGENAAPNVIGHHYIGGNGSHSAYYRVDGQGPCLIFAPTGETALTFYDCRPWFDRNRPELRKREDGPGKGCTMLYPFAAARGKRAQEKGAKLRIPQQEKTLKAGEAVSFTFGYFWAEHFLKAGKYLAENGLVYAVSVPGYTLPVNTQAKLCLESAWKDLDISVEDGSGRAVLERTEEGRVFFTLTFTALGEHTVTVRYGKNRFMHLYYFITEPVETLWNKRAAFIAKNQVKDESLWYNGLLCEWNNETGVRLSPDNYDRIGGWRIYEVTCDDPGLAKPAFLSTKQTVLPKQEEITALDDYIDHFVWGGLQQTTEEPYPYGIYGIPDWKTLRDSKDEGTRGKLHIWRIYDYPHIALMYYNMYCVARDYPEMQTKHSGEEYLRRAYGTAAALFTIPSETEDWSAYKTGLYNERVIPRIIEALRECGMNFEARRLETFWMRKVKFFVTECEDVFGSEYPFDTTGFETTYYLAEDALQKASFEKDDSPFAEGIPYGKAVGFMQRQHDCNTACRGYLEPAYFWYGSDYRGNNTHYLLSYMSQMGGCSILEHALYHEREPWEMLRLGYGSLLSSYALMNTGTEESGYGYWFPGKEHDGAAGGGFESLYEGETWLNQPHHGGSWYYSCEIDLGFCGGVRGAAVILAKDPLFGWIAYGAELKKEEGERCTVVREDGAGRAFHYLKDEMRFHAVLDHGAFDRTAVKIDGSGKKISLYFDSEKSSMKRTLHLSGTGMGKWCADGIEETNGEAWVVLVPGQTQVTVEFQESFGNL